MVATISKNASNFTKVKTSKEDNVTVLVALAMINLRPIPDHTISKKGIKRNYLCTPCTYGY